MKRIFYFFICLLLTHHSKGQTNSKSYQDLKKKGDSLYRARDFQQAAQVYTKIVKLPGETLTIWDWDHAAFCWALADNKDSAFYFLNIIAKLDSISYKDYIDVVDDRDFAGIRNDPRWKKFLHDALQTARVTFLRLEQGGDESAILKERKMTAIAWRLNEDHDSVFYHLDLFSNSKALTFATADELVKNGYLRPLHNDKRWPAFKTKIYGKLVEGLSMKIRTMGDKASISDRREAAIAFSYSDQADSAFHQLYKIASARELTFEDVFLIVTDGEFSNINTASPFKPLENDKRWPELKDKLFLSLYKKYIPESAFDKTRMKNKQLLIDGGHFNLHDMEGTYAPLAGALRFCGIETKSHKTKFDVSSLKDKHMLIISNPNPDRQDSIARRAARAKEPLRWSTAATQPGYTNNEVAAIHDWVKNGGSLLLILDHAPNGKVGEALAAAFGIENRNVGTYDTLSRDPMTDTTEAKTIIFTRSNNLIGTHSIVEGIDSITTYTGESLIGPPGSDVLLYLPATAYDQDWLPETKQFRIRSAAGRTQAVAFEYGKGRVVMLGEAAVTRPRSLSLTNRGNRKFVLNIIRWLAREM